MRKKTLNQMMKDHSSHEVSFPDNSGTFVCTWLRNVPYRAGVNHYRCYAIREILWSRSRLQEISIFLTVLLMFADRVACSGI